MSDAYERWIASLRSDPPPEFPDKVMAHVGGAAGRLERWWRQPVVRVAAWIAASIVLAVRVALAAAVFMVA